MSIEKKNIPITKAFGKVFNRIKNRETFESPPLEELGERIFDAIVTAALAKCVQFNIIANRSRKHRDEEFALVSNLRGICEDLITLSYISQMSPDRKDAITKLLMMQAQADGIDAQEAFFYANNPYQPVFGQRNHPMLGSHKGSSEMLPSRSRAARDVVKKFWLSGNPVRKKAPTVKEMASEIGLNFTYDYIYFASSNFVHFNPQALMKLGGATIKIPFVFP